MITIWSYLPITIHLEKSHIIEKDTNTNLIAISGVYLFNSYTKNYYILAINDVPHVNKYSFKFTATSLMTTTHINWFPLYLYDIKFMNDRKVVPSEFMGFVNGLMSNDQFRFKPHNSTYLSIMSFKVAVNVDNLLKPIIDHSKLLPIVFQDSTTIKIPSKVTIQCCPFSLTNAAIFSSYRIFGSINYSIRDSGFLSDTRYMDDIIGGIVTLGNHSADDLDVRKSIGLVCGALVKTNGDGELLTIVSWNKIISALELKNLKLTKSSQLPHPLSKNMHSNPQSIKLSNLDYNPIESIVRITVTTSLGQFWGSGVVFSNNYIITNKHVVNLDNLEYITIATVDNIEIKFTFKDFTTELPPLTGFDLCFMKLKKPINHLVPIRIADSCTSEPNSLKIGQPVKSIGYGLCFLKGANELKPLHSEGFINSIVDLELEEIGNQEKSLLLVSASCWNGSSGGGLLNLNNELIGIMTSNGKLSSGEILTNFTLAIPINVIIKCIFMLQTNSPSFDVTQKVQDLWSLKNTHESRLINSITHKL